MKKFLKHFSNILAVAYCFFLQSEQLPALTADAACAVNAISGYTNVSGWEFDSNGAICSPEYIAYIFKHLPIYDGIHNIISLHGGFHPHSQWGSYVLLLYTEDGSCIPAGFFAWASGYRSAQDITYARIRDWGIPGVAACTSSAMRNCTTQYPQNLQTINNQKLSTSNTTLAYSTTPQLLQFLANNLNNLAIGLIPTTRTLATSWSESNPGIDGIQYYDTLQKEVIADNNVSSSIGSLGHYYTLIQRLLMTEPFPTSDTSALMLGIDPSDLFNHPLYLFFAANKYSRNTMLTDSASAALLEMTVLFHRFKVLKDRVNTENWKQNPDMADVYELLAIMTALLPGYSTMVNGNMGTLPDIRSWKNLNDTTSQLYELTPDQLQVISDANNYIENNIPTEINRLHAAGICQDGSTNCASYNKLPLISFNQHGSDIQLFNWNNPF